MDFNARYQSLNERQRLAVDTIDGPLMVIAGPGTGKTELLSMRVASILKRTDTLPESILCLTYTDSGVTAIRKRLSEIIGPAAYKVAVHTFHSFSTEIINQNREFFYNGASFRAADELHCYEILRSIFDELGQGHILKSQMNGSYVYLKDVQAVIGELKTNGLTGEELIQVLDANQSVIATSESLLAPIFAEGIKKITIDRLAGVPDQIIARDQPLTIEGIPSYGSLIAESLRNMIDEAQNEQSTKPITAWRNAWMKKNSRGEYILKANERQQKLRLVSEIYDTFLERMQQAGLFDFDDMIMNTLHTLESTPELRFNIQEKYLYVMVDEFQDTNLAQMRILFSLINSEIYEGLPNIMVVGDDDQAIYGFQGANVGNIHSFIETFPNAPRIVLTDNYRSSEAILARSRSVITLGSDRLERLMPDIDKQLTARKSDPLAPPARIVELDMSADERQYVASRIKRLIEEGNEPSSIAVLARRHHELVDLLPYLAEAGLKVNYERQDNVLDLDTIRQIEYIANLLLLLLDGHITRANAMLPQLLAHPAFNIEPLTLWKLSVKAQNDHLSWLELMPQFEELAPLHTWLIEQSQAAAYTPLERMIDLIIGAPNSSSEDSAYASPLYNYYFSPEQLENDPSLYLTHLSGLITLRARLREYYPDDTPTLRTLMEFIRLEKESGSTITSIQPASARVDDAINLMTAHKSKGLEFDTVFVIGAVDTAWGEKARSRSRLISYPENLPLTPPGERLDDRLRLFYVAMTRARKQLVITYSTSDDSGKSQLPASFLSGGDWQHEKPDFKHTETTQVHTAELSWYQPIIRPLSSSQRELLAPRLENYKLSATHLCNFIDLTRGGPEAFIVNDLLKFPQAPSPSSAYGNAVHKALQQAHAYVLMNGEQKPHDAILSDFESLLKEYHLPSDEFQQYLERGKLSLGAFLQSDKSSFRANQKTELNFGGQGVVIGDTHLSGILDVIEIDDMSLKITDYKTGKPLESWQGKNDIEKIKLHRFRMQLLFYDLLISGSRDFSKYSVESCAIQFVEPNREGDIIRLEATFTNEERDRLKRLISAVCSHITTLTMPDTANFEPTYKGILAFEDSLLTENQ